MLWKRWLEQAAYAWDRSMLWRVIRYGGIAGAVNHPLTIRRRRDPRMWFTP